MKPTLSLVASLFAGLGACAVQCEKLTSVPQGWTSTDQPVDPSQVIKLSIALRQPEANTIQSKVGYGKPFLSQKQVEALRAPSPQDVQIVMAWLAQNGIRDATPENDWIRVRTTVGKAESLLNMTLRKYVFNGHSKRPKLRTTEYSIPDSLENVITFVHPISNFMTPERDAQLDTSSGTANFPADASNPCANAVTPSCLKQLYNITYVPASDSKVTLGVAGFLDQYANFADVANFLSKQDPAAVGRNFTVETVNGGLNSQNPGQAGSEANLDIEYAMGLASGTNVVFYATGGRGEELGDSGKPVPDFESSNEPYLDLLEHLLGKDDAELPSVVSISYGDNELSVPRAYADKVCDLFGMLSGRGVTIVSSSGDGGATGSVSSHCVTNDGTHRQITMATFPATCQWVTTVGSTTNSGNPPSGAGFSSGGFSYWYPRPSWQRSDLINAYLDALDGHLDGKYNPSNRAFPDIALVGTQFSVIVGGRSALLRGTSASCPTFASMLALVNDARQRQGKGNLGFINELLYSDKVRAVLQDITTGQSSSCFWDGSAPGGWPAAKGWDAITGLGVPSDFNALMDVLVAA